MAEELYDVDFPNLRKLGFKRTSESAYYNCVAYAVGDFKRKWWPGDYPPFWSVDYWPDEVPKDETLEAFVLALATVRYEMSNDGNPELGFEKVAIYALGGVVKHAALQQQNGAWRSKLGSAEDIEHTLDGLEGPTYGKVVAFLKRSRNAAVSLEPEG
jgi:hypothetical protein